MEYQSLPVSSLIDKQAMESSAVLLYRSLIPFHLHHPSENIPKRWVTPLLFSCKLQDQPDRDNAYGHRGDDEGARRRPSVQDARHYPGPRSKAVPSPAIKNAFWCGGFHRFGSYVRTLGISPVATDRLQQESKTLWEPGLFSG